MHFGYYNKKKAKKKEKYVENLKKSIFFYSFQYIFYYIMTSNSRKISFFRSFSPQPFISAKPHFFNQNGASGDTAFFKKHSNINGFRTPEQRNYLYSSLLKQSISAAIARFISR